MTVTVEFLSLPNVVEMVGSRSVAIDLPGATGATGATVPDLIAALVRRFGEPLGAFLLDPSGALDYAVQVRLNRREWLRREQFDRPLADGDHVTFAMLLGGG